MASAGMPVRMPVGFYAGASGADSLQPLTATANRQQKFRSSVPPGNYSGIAHIGGNRYAVVSDKSPEDGFYIFRIDIDTQSGKIKTVENEGYMSACRPNRDMEGVAWFPVAGTVFVSGESDNEVLEYALDGSLTGRRLAMPQEFLTAIGNYGLEALTYNAATHRFWTTSESTLPADGMQASAGSTVRNVLRLQSFGDDLNPAGQYLYEMDVPTASRKPRHYAMGVSGLCALDDGRLIVLEREFFVASAGLGSYVRCKLYVVDPASAPSGTRLHKKLLLGFRTRLTLFGRSLANYEGICLGPRLDDGSRVLLLVSDSQSGYRGVLKDWFRTIVIK